MSKLETYMRVADSLQKLQGLADGIGFSAMEAAAWAKEAERLIGEGKYKKALKAAKKAKKLAVKAKNNAETISYVFEKLQEKLAERQAAHFDESPGNDN